MNITIVTVCKNAKGIIEHTIESVLKQRDVSFEYLLVDGLSSDGTLDVIESYRDAFKSRGIELNVHSGKDSGIYDAMNIGASLAKGDWILYLNAGDYLYTDDVISRMSKVAVTNDTAVIYGDVLYTYYSKYKPFYSRPVEQITNNYIFCHQSVLTRKDVLTEGKFDLKYKICADYDLYLRSYLQGHKMIHVNIPVSVYDNNGYSSRNFYLASHIERSQIQHKLGLISEKEEKKQISREKLKRSVPGFFEHILPCGMVKAIICPLLKAKGWQKEFVKPEDFYKFK